MSTAFDPHHKWLDISPEEQPADYYRLLGIKTFESDPDVIESGADQRMAHLRTFQSGQHSDLSQKILNEIAAARTSTDKLALAKNCLPRGWLRLTAPRASMSCST